MNYEKQVDNLVKQMRRAEGNMQNAAWDGDLDEMVKFLGILTYLNDSYESLTGNSRYDEQFFDQWNSIINNLNESEDVDDEF